MFVAEVRVDDVVRNLLRSIDTEVSLEWRCALKSMPAALSCAIELNEPWWDVEW